MDNNDVFEIQADEVTIEVIERARAGFFGIGSSNAVVKVSYEQEDKKSDRVKEFLYGLFEHMNVEAEAKIISESEDKIEIDLVGDNIGALIGRRGETLDAIQHLANYSLNKDGGDRIRINIDAENYRAKRTESLERLAKKVAGKVLKYRKNITLEPMNAYERHVIHIALQDTKGVTTFSTGNEPQRRVVVAYERGGKVDYSEPRHEDRRHSSQRRSSSRPAAPKAELAAPVETAPQPEVKKTYKEWA